MNEPIRISVVMPSFNQAPFLAEAIESVLSQGLALHELIVLDGGSSDGSREVIQSYADRIEFWRSAPDNGQSDALREGFERATGDFLCWLNSDDLFVPGAFDAVQRAVMACPDAEVVSGYLYYFDEHGRVTECPQVLTGSHALARMGVVNVNQQATFFSRDLYRRVGGIDPSLHCAMDMDLWSKFHVEGARWIHVPKYLAGFRKHSEQKGSGGPWWDRYQVEKATVRSRYPQLFGTPLRQRIGLACYRFVQLASGRHLRGLGRTRRLAGMPLREAATR